MNRLTALTGPSGAGKTALVLDSLIPAARALLSGSAQPGHVRRLDLGGIRQVVQKVRLRPMRGLKQDRSAGIVIAGHAFIQNVRRGHYELTVEVPATRRVAVAFDEFALAI